MALGFDQSNFNPLKQRETAEAAKIIAILAKHFPGYEWHVIVDINAGMAWVYTEFSGNYGVRGPLKQFIHDPDMKLLVLMVGEFLERYRLSREKADQEIVDHIVTQVDGLPVAEADAQWTP